MDYIQVFAWCCQQRRRRTPVQEGLSVRQGAEALKTLPDSTCGLIGHFGQRADVDQPAALCIIRALSMIVRSQTS